jgi:cobalt/nickel transport system permease protein
MKRAMSTRTVPLLSVFSAFSFVVMMFNLPLPGGTTGHAVGMGIAAIMLGPWTAILAVSIALMIQAVFFGDGGVTAIGANCFNMAIVGSIAAYSVYRVLGWRAPVRSARRLVAAGLAGYIGINLAALFAAVEFGVQPALFYDAAGSPLYCPYPLSISIPAMMIGHLTFAGLAEMVITAGVVAYFQRADPELLLTTAPDAPDCGNLPERAEPLQWPTTRKLWSALALLLILTPLGILAAGAAWGEWSAEDFNDPAVRGEIAAASANHEPPTGAPEGLSRLSSLWAAPIARYSPAFVRNASVGYVLSTMIGVGLILLTVVEVNWLARKLTNRQTSPRAQRRSKFVEKTVASLLATMERVLFAEDISRSQGLLQRLDARAKVAGLAAVIVSAMASRRIAVLGALLLFAAVLAFLSNIPLRTIMVRTWLPVIGFTGLIALPAIFSTPGIVLFHVPLLQWPITAQGLRSACFLLLRAETAATYMILIILSTSWVRVLRSLRFFRLPVPVVVVLSMTFRYIFLLLQIAHNMFEARSTRLVGTLDESDRQRLAAGTVSVLLDRSLQLSSDVHQAMIARGYRGDVYLLNDLAMSSSDWYRLSVLLGVAVLAFWMGR